MPSMEQRPLTQAESTALVLRNMRMQAWERAKGELRAALATFYSSAVPLAGPAEQFARLETEVNRFIIAVESNGLAE